MVSSGARSVIHYIARAHNALYGIRRKELKSNPPKHPNAVRQLLQNALRFSPEERVAFFFQEGLSLREIGSQFTKKKHPQIVSKLLRRFCHQKYGDKLSPVT